MGVYNTFGKLHVQLKVQPDLNLTHYNEGDSVPNLWDGIYVSYEGAVVILDGMLAKTFPFMLDKWGGILDCGDVIKEYNPIMHAAKALVEERENQKRFKWFGNSVEAIKRIFWRNQ